MKSHLFLRTPIVVVLSAVLVWSAAPAPLPLKVQRVLGSITAADLKGDLSFLASDALQGRYTPSPGLDVAAEFIASQFRAAGLEPGGDQDYFQTAAMVDRRMPKAVSNMTLQEGEQVVSVPAQDITITALSRAVRVEHASAIVFASKDPELLKSAELDGKAVVAPQPSLASIPPDQRMTAFRKARAFDNAVAGSKAALEISIGAQRPGQSSRLLPADEAQHDQVPAIAVSAEELQKWIEHPAADSEARSVSIELPAPEDHNVTVKNVIGILRGSDPKLKNTCVLLTAHYDHIGTTETGSRMTANRMKNPNDHIFNGANDDGSGTVSVIEIAKALSKMTPHPKRSMVFMTFFGEERGELGSQYYGKHPVFPIANTVADLNLEQVGRTDSTVGRHLNNASVTGFDYSDVTDYLKRAGARTGINVYLDKEASDAYFTRSDNASLAEQGVPAHSLTVAFDYPDYHGLGDEWQKIDYDNMARVDRMIALGLLDIANSLKAPEWNAQNPKTSPFREAQEKSRGRPSA